MGVSFMRKVYITGLGFISSIGNDAATVAQNLRSMRHGIRLFAPFQGDDSPVKVAAPVEGFDTSSLDPEDWTFPAGVSIRREILRGMSPHVAYAWCAMKQAILDSKLTEEDVSNEDTGIYTASAGSPHFVHSLISKMNAQGVLRCPPLGVVAAIAGTLNFNLVSGYRIRGASCGFTSACASSAHALGFAHDEIALGRQKRMFVVGAEDCNRESILPFAGMRALSLQKNPDLASRPFDTARDGFVGTGGSAVLVLESEEEVARRGVKPYCEVAGWGQSSDGHNVAIPHPEGLGLLGAMRRALASAGVEPTQIEYVNAHATSTPIGDISEAKALRRIFAEAGGRPAVSSTKALTGHGLSLAGALESGICALSMREGFTPGSAGITSLDPACEGLNILRETLTTAPALAMSNSSGFGGANVSVVFRRA